jgi:hypothetical protein
LGLSVVWRTDYTGFDESAPVFATVIPPTQYDFRAYYAAGYAVIHQLPDLRKTSRLPSIVFVYAGGSVVVCASGVVAITARTMAMVRHQSGSAGELGVVIDFLTSH